MSVASALFVIGLLPSYVSIFIVEKHYTAFWTGFWNIYGLLVTSVGLAMDNYNPWAIWVLFGIIVMLAVLVYALVWGEERNFRSEIQAAEAYFFRRVGASWVATSLNWGLYVGFTAGVLWGILVIPVHAVLMIVLLVALFG